MRKEEMEAYVRNHYRELSAREIADRTGMTKGMVYNLAKKLGLRKSKEWIADRASKQNGRAEERRRYILAHYADTPMDEMVRFTGLKAASIYHIANVLGVARSEEYKRDLLRRLGSEVSGLENSKKTRFQKGHVPANKGKAMREETRMKVSATFFRKGNVPYNVCPVGHTAVTTDGYAKIKIAEPNVWRYRSYLVWEEANGKVPPNHVLYHLDGDKLNDDLSNLRLLSRRELQLSNRHKDYPLELIEVWNLANMLKEKVEKL